DLWRDPREHAVDDLLSPVVRRQLVAAELSAWGASKGRHHDRLIASRPLGEADRPFLRLVKEPELGLLEPASHLDGFLRLNADESGRNVPFGDTPRRVQKVRLGEHVAD